MFYWKWKQNFARPGVFPGSFLVFWKMNRHHRPLQEFAMRFFRIPERGKILDVGCGGGFFCHRSQSRRNRQNKTDYFRMIHRFDS